MAQQFVARLLFQHEIPPRLVTNLSSDPLHIVNYSHYPRTDNISGRERHVS